jgi:hypothetical protein
VRHLLAVTPEKFRRREVMIQNDSTGGQVRESLAQGRSQGKVKDGDIAGTWLDKFGKKLRILLKTGVPGQTIYFGLKSLREKKTLHMIGGIPDGIPAVKGRYQLVDPLHPDTFMM